MPDSPSIPTTGWNGLPKRKARPLLVQVARDRLRPAPATLWDAASAHSPPRRRLTALVGAIIVFTGLVFLFLYFDQGHHRDLQSRKAGPPDIWDGLLFQGEDVDSDGDALHENGPEAYVQDANSASSDQLPFSCPAYKSNGTIAAKYANTPNLLKRSILHAGSGSDLTRVLRRAARLSKSWKTAPRDQTANDAFRVLVMGGSVSNCRGVERSKCWHTHVMRWLSNMFPLGSAQDRSQVSYRFIDLAKSATGSAFFSYCWQSELELRKKNTPYYWGEGPDLVIIETGINDVVSPGDFTSKRTRQSYATDFESLLWQVKSLPSRPAVVVLDAPSKLLERTQGFNRAAEFTTHLTPSVWLDVPVISGKTALLTASAKMENGAIEDLYLADGHHPNEKGHEMLADLLLYRLEELVCQVPEQPEISPVSESDNPRTFSAPHLSTARTIGKTAGECIQVGAGGEKKKPKKNRGWSRLAPSRDKQYMTSSSPGSRLIYEVKVGEKGQILLSWLKSRFYNLGEARVLLDGQRPGVRISGHWDLGWSIGVPTVLFENVTAGIHSVTIEHVSGKLKGAGSSNFRLIALVST